VLLIFRAILMAVHDAFAALPRRGTAAAVTRHERPDTAAACPADPGRATVRSDRAGTVRPARVKGTGRIEGTGHVKGTGRDRWRGS